MRNVRFNASVGPQRTYVGSGSGTGSASRRASVQRARQQMQGIIKEYRKLVEHIEEVTPEILYEALLPTFKKSQTYVPKDTGALRDSGYLEITSFRGRPTVEMGYGKGGMPPYAVRVHENMEWKHKAPTRAKFLQAALAEDSSAIQARIVAGMKRIGF